MGNEDRSGAMAYVVVLSPPLNQLLGYYIPETEQDATRCALRQHRSSDKRSTVEMGHVIPPRE